MTTKHTTLQLGSGSTKRSKKRVVRIGTASWADPGFVADWYPLDLPAADRLAWYADHFNLVEVNSSFYGVPSPKVTELWCEQTPDDFVFDIKLHKLLSRHSTQSQLLPADLRPAHARHGVKVDVTPELETALVSRFLEAAAPITAAGKMGAFLLQLSPAFRPLTTDLSELDHLVQLLKGYSLAVELRNRDWLVGEQKEKTIAYFESRKVALVSVDAPSSDHFTVMPESDSVTNPQLAYFRAHGRNAQGYVSGRTVAERFDHKYSVKELHEVAGRIEELAELSTEIHVIFNNNKSNYALLAAGRMKQILAI